ncbi:MAG TPA: MFS transporter, partial [Ktedonobacterales bacterium]
WQIALVLFVLQRFHSPALAGLTTFLAIAPGLACSPIAGALLDRNGRVRMILVDYAMAAGALILIFVLALTDHLNPVVLLPIVTLSSLTNPLSATGVRTLFPLVTPRDLWDRANAIDSGSQALAFVLGPALGGYLIAWFGAGAFLGTALLFVLAGLVLFGIKDPPTAVSDTGPLLRSAWQALVYVLHNASLRGITLTFLASNIGGGIQQLALPVLIFTHFHWGADAVGELWSVAGVATVIAGLTVGRVRTDGNERRMISVGMTVLSLGGVLLVAADRVSFGLPLLVVAMLLFGFSAGPIDLGIFALRQRRTDPAWFGRAFAVSMALNYAGAPIGSALGGPIVESSIFVALVVAAVISLGGVVMPYLAIPEKG